MHPGAIGPALQEQAFQLLGNKGWGILGWQSTLNPPAPGPIKVGGPLMSLRQCGLAPAHQGCQTGSYQSGIHPGFIEKQLVCQMGRNSILERTPRKRLQPTMLFASRISQRQGPHTPSPEIHVRISRSVGTSHACASTAGARFFKQVLDFERSRSSSYQ